jgi:hypothetical protein
MAKWIQMEGGGCDVSCEREAIRWIGESAPFVLWVQRPPYWKKHSNNHNAPTPMAPIAVVPDTSESGVHPTAPRSLRKNRLNSRISPSYELIALCSG